MIEATMDPELKALISDFDHHSPEYARRYRDVFQYLHTLPTKALRSERYGGFWLLTDYKALQEIQRRQDVFSNRQITIPKSAAPHLIPAFEDPPNHIDFRRMLNKWFSPLAVNQMFQRIGELTEQRFALVEGRDEFDVVLDIAQPLTGMLTMELLGLNPAEFDDYAEPIHNATFDHGTEEERMRGFMAVMGRVKRDVAAKRAQPTGIMGDLIQADFQGRKLTDAEVEAITLNLLVGGLGTSQGFVGSVSVFLAQNPELRAELVAEPELLDSTALDEFLRYLAPVQTTAKVALADYDVTEGVRIKQGELVLLAYGGANLDPAFFTDPLKVDLRRKTNPVMTFGVGQHRCLGSHIAKAITRFTMRKLLEVAPNYQLVEGGVEPAHSIAHIMGYRSVMLSRR